MYLTYFVYIVYHLKAYFRVLCEWSQLNPSNLQAEDNTIRSELACLHNNTMPQSESQNNNKLNKKEKTILVKS